MTSPLAALESLQHEFEGAFASAETELALRTVNAQYLGSEGQLTLVLKRMPEIPGPERKPFGQAANALKQAIEKSFETHLSRIRAKLRKTDLEGPALDVTLPGRNVRRGRLHPITETAQSLLDVFASLGFEISESREIELPEFNFTKLGFPPDHPATDMQDSFFVDTGGEPMLLRTHATAIQVHEMLARKPPMAVVTAGTVYRRDDDATHSPMFHQVDGFYVGRGVTFAHLKGVLSEFVRKMFGQQVPTRFRPSYFPFVEPGGELDMGCVFCNAWQGDEQANTRRLACRVCKATGWVEVLGCGMIHPVVLENCGVDTSEFGGFAWGMGIDRIAMLRYGIRDIRMLYENDMRFLAQL